MSLAQELDALQAKNREQIPDTYLEVMDDATASLKASGLLDNTVREGQCLPNVTLPNATGDQIALSDVWAEGPTVVTFYRGGWCPYCNLTLHALQQALPEFKALGATLVAITPEQPDKSLSTSEKHGLEFQVLSDEGNAYARELGIVFELPAKLKEIYGGFGLNLPQYNGDESWTLPLAATFVVDSLGTIRYAFLDADYTQRAEPAKLLAVLKDLRATA